MNYSRRLNLPSKLFVSIFLFISILLTFTACENFLQGEDVKEEITKTIEYNNAPSYTINVEALKGTGVIKTPATGEVEKKVTDVFPVRFEPEDSCKFIRWEAVISELGEGETPSDYIQFENAESLETKVTFKKATATGSVIVIRPVCPPRLTYTFEQDGGIIYPKDSSIEFNFNQALSAGCLAGTAEEEVKASNYVSIQELTGGVDASTYFNPPEITNKRLLFRSDTSFSYIPLINNQRMISVRIPKEQIWYVNEQYTTPVRVYLDSDISKTFIIGPETSKKTVINYKVRKNGEEDLGILKIDGDALDNKNHEYSVGQKISLRYQLPDNYSFIDWKFLDADGNPFTEENLKLTYTKEAESENLQILNIVVDNYIEKVVTIVPEICDPVKIKIVKGSVGIDSFKIDKTAIAQEEQSFEYGVGKSFVLNCKMAEGFTFTKWKFSYDDAEIALDDPRLHITLSDADVSNGIAQLQITINEYMGGVISVAPVFCDPVKIKIVKGTVGIDNFKIDKTAIAQEEQSFEYGVGKSFALSCKMAEGFTFSKWKFLYDNAELALDDPRLHLTLSDADVSNGIAQLQITIKEYMSGVISVVPVVCYPVKIKFLKDAEGVAAYKTDAVALTQEEQILEYGVEKSVNLSCKPQDGYSFFGWDYKRTYTNEKGEAVTEILTKDSLEELGIKFSFDEDTASTDGYDSSTRLAQAKITVLKYTDNIISIKPIIIQNLAVTAFNNSDVEKTYYRDSNIELTFNHSLLESSKDKLKIKIQGVEDSKVADYFETAVLAENKLTISAKKTKLIPLLSDETNTITLILPASDFIYEAQTTDGKKYNVGLTSDLTYTYKISSETREKTKIKVQLYVDKNDENKDNETETVGTLKVNNTGYLGDFDYSYSIGNTVSITYGLGTEEAANWKFKQWELSHTYTDAVGQPQTEKIVVNNVQKFDYLNLSVSSGGASGTAGLTIIINGTVDGSITVQPILEYIADVKIVIDGSHGKFTPEKGEKNYKLGQTYHIEYEPDSDFEFIRWRVMNANDEFSKIELSETELNQYIKSDDLSKEKADLTFITVPDIKLELNPLIVERPQTISVSPQRNSGGVYRDTSIQVMFDYDMDESSIYYTEEEVNSFIYEMDLPCKSIEDLSKMDFPLDFDCVLYYENADGIKKYYGYQKGGQRYFKNITIVNKANKSNIIDRFSYPIFQNASTLSIPVNRNRPLAAGVNVMVTLDKGFFYKLNDKDIAMSTSEKWVYLVNGKTDTEIPEVKDFVLKDSLGKTVSSLTTAPTDSTVNVNTINYLKAGDFNLAVNIHDNTAPDTFFTVKYKKILDANYQNVTNSTVYSKSLEYTNFFGEDAYCGVLDDDNKLTPGLFTLQGLADGVYGIYFEFKDGSGNSVYSPDNRDGDNKPIPPTNLYYVSLDATAPIISAPAIKSPEDSSTSLSLSWDKSKATDYNKAYFEYKKYTDTSYSSSNKTGYFDATVTSATLSNLEVGTRYNVKAHYFDVAGNETTEETSAYTRPAAPKSVSLSSVYGTSVTVTAEKPDEGLFTNMAVRYKKTTDPDTSWSEMQSFNVGTDGKGSKTISGLEKGCEYEFEVCSYDNASKKYSPVYKNGSAYPKFMTIPEAPASISDNSGSFTNSITVNWTAPSAGTITGYYVYLSPTEDFASETTTKTESLSNTTTSYTFNSLTPGKKYFAKVECYYGDTGNSAALTKSSYSYTRAAPVSNLTLVSTTKDSLTVSWAKPESAYVGYYYIYYKNTKDSSWSGNYVYNSNTTSYKIENLSGGEKYNIRMIAYSYNWSDAIENSSDGWQICPNPVTNLNAQKINDTSLKLTWSKPVGNYDGYNIYYYNENESGYPSTRNLTIVDDDEVTDSDGYITKTITGLASQKFYNIKVESYIGSGSLKTPETTTCSLKLDGVKSVSASATATSKIKLSWTNPAADAFTGIRIYRGTTKIKEITDKSTTSYEDTGLSTNTQYTYKIETYKVEYGDEFNTYTTKSCYTYSALISNLSAISNEPGVMELSWSNPSSSNYNDIYIYRGSYYVTTITNKNTNSYTIKDLTGGTSYSFSIRTRNGDGVINPNYSGTTAEVSGKYTMPSPVTGLSWSPSKISQTSAYISWSKPSGSYTGVKVYYKLSTASSWTLYTTYADNTTTSCTVSNLTAGKIYNFRVDTYHNSVSNSSSYSYPTCQGYTQCATVTNVAVSTSTDRTTSSITYTWTNPTSNYSGVRLYYKASSSSSYSYIPMSSGATSYTLTGLSTGTSYDVYFASYYYSSSYLSTSNTTGCSASYPLKTSTKPGVPGAPSFARTSSAGIKLSWSAPSDGNVTGYYIYYKRHSSSSYSYYTSTTNRYCEIGNTSLANTTQYDFYVVSYYTANSETVFSGVGTAKSYYTMPAAISSSYYSVYCDDTMGNIVIRWYNPSYESSGVNVYLDSNSSYTTYTSDVSKNSYSTCKVTIPSYARGSSHKIRIRPYHSLNGSEQEGPETQLTYNYSGTYNSTRSKNEYLLMINGSRIENSELKNVITSSTTISNNETRTGGAFTKKRVVTLSPYSMGACEVTRGLFKDVMGYDPSGFTSDQALPVGNVTWYDAIAFCNRLSAIQGLTPYYNIDGINSSWWATASLSRKSGTSTSSTIYIPTSTTNVWDGVTINSSSNGYHLPTEAQWEFAGRGGSTSATDWGYMYSGSNSLTWIARTESNSPVTVGSFNSNRLGLYDMTGNMWEWLTDWNNDVPDGTFTDPYCGRNTSLNTTAKPSTMKYSKDGILLKGSGYKSSSSREIDYNSNKSYPCTTYYDYGFRICRNKTY